MTVHPIFAWYDMWVGAYWDMSKRRLYIFPIPMFGLMIQLNKESTLDEFLKNMVDRR